LDGARAARADPTLAGTVRARVADPAADAAALGARARRDELTEERPLHGLHLAPAAAGLAGLGMGAGSGPAALAPRAQHCRVEGELPCRAERGLGQVELDPDQCVRTGSHP